MFSEISTSIAEFFSHARPVLFFQGGYNTSVVISGTSLLGVAAGAVGSFALLRRRALVGDAAAHASLPGLVLAFLISAWLGNPGKHLPLLLIGAALSGVLGLLTLQLISKYTRLGEEAATGIVLSVFFGFGVLLLSLVQSMGTGEEGGLQHFIFGQAAALSSADVYLAAACALGSLIVIVALMKEFRVLCFDRDFAQSQGYPTSFLDLVLLTLIVTVTIVGLQSVGMLLIVSFLIVPATAARFWSDSLGTNVALSAVLGGLSGYLGAVLSALEPRLPTGATIVLVAGVFFAISLLFAPRRGVFAAIVRRAHVGLRVAFEHLLRELYERLETIDPEERGSISLDIRQIRAFRMISPLTRRVMIETLRWTKFAKILPARKIRLTAAGISYAHFLTRRHRLWESYLLAYGSLPHSHVEYSADIAEHVLSEDALRAIERSLPQDGSRSR